jgi:hypothetical protein
MGKKCIPGFFCIENMTLFLLFVVFVLLFYVWYGIARKQTEQTTLDDSKTTIVVVQQPPLLANPENPFTNPFAPPMKTDPLFYPTGVPINMQTRGINTGYQQIGILTKSGGNANDLILPLMGRRIMTGRDKWQYYTMSNTGSLSTKLPISMNGKSCTSEYGCDNINNGDIVYVEGYNDTFRATVYENNLFQYIPV